MSLRLSAEEVERRLTALNVELLEPYIGTSIKVRVLYCECNHERLVRLDSIFGGSPCLVCDLNRRIAVFDAVCQAKNFTRIGEYVKNTIPVLVRCETCKHEWAPLYTNLVGKGSGCPGCANMLPLTNGRVDERLMAASRPIQRLGDCTNGATPIEWLCLTNGCGIDG